MSNKQINNLSNLLKEIDIVKLIQNYINLTKKGQNYWCVCPFHNDSSPSMSVSEKKRFFKCFACNHSGNAIKFVMDFKKISFYDAIKEIEEVLNLNLGINNISISEHDVKLFNLMNLVKDTYEGFLFRDENKDKLDYLLNRKISLNQIQKFSIGYAVDKQKQIVDIALNKNNIRGFSLEKSEIFNLEDMELTKLVSIDRNGDVHDFFRNRIIIPIFDETNNVVGFSGRAIGDEKPKYMNSPTSQIFKKEEILYNMNNLNSSVHTCYLVEGFMDLYALDSIGIQNPFATMGTSFSEFHLKWLINNKITDIVLCFDNDNAGLEATIKTGIKIGKRLNVFTLKPNQSELKDFNDILVKNGDEQLMKIVSSTIHFSIYYLEHFLMTSNNNGDIDKQNNFKEAIQIIKNSGNSLYNLEYKKIINKYLSIEESIIEKELNNIFNDRKTYVDKSSNNFQIINYKGDKESYFNKKTTLQTIETRIINLNHYLFHCAAFKKDFFNYITHKCTIIDIPRGMNFMFNLLGEYYLDTNSNSVFDNRLDFYEKYKEHRMIKYIEALLNSFNELFDPTFSTIDNMIKEIEKNNILYQISVISSKLEKENLTDEEREFLNNKKKILFSKKLSLEKRK